VVGLPHADLVGGGAAGLEPLGAPPGLLYGQLEVRDRAVERVVLAAVGVGVPPRDELPAVRVNPAPHGDVAAREREPAARRRVFDLRASHPIEPSEAVPLPV